MSTYEPHLCFPQLPMKRFYLLVVSPTGTFTTSSSGGCHRSLMYVLRITTSVNLDPLFTKRQRCVARIEQRHDNNLDTTGSTKCHVSYQEARSHFACNSSQRSRYNYLVLQDVIETKILSLYHCTRLLRSLYCGLEMFLSTTSVFLNFL